MLNYRLLGLVKRFPHEDIFLNSSVENPGLLGDISKCPIGCDGAPKKVHLKDKIKETEKLYLLDILCTVRNSKNFFFLLLRLLLDLAKADRMPYSYVLTFIPFLSSVYFHLPRLFSTCSTLLIKITVSSAYILVHRDFCLTFSISISITTAKKKRLRATH